MVVYCVAQAFDWQQKGSSKMKCFSFLFHRYRLASARIFALIDEVSFAFGYCNISINIQPQGTLKLCPLNLCSRFRLPSLSMTDTRKQSWQEELHFRKSIY